MTAEPIAITVTRHQTTPPDRSRQVTTFDATVTPDWASLCPKDQRAFLAAIAEPDAAGCCAWQGQMRGGYPDWTRIDQESRTRHRAQARRLLAQKHGVRLSGLDQVVITCGNPGCMAWPHLAVERQKSQAITDEERQTALHRMAGREPQCPKHEVARFRADFKRQKSGNVTVRFRCTTCEMERRDMKNRAGRTFKDARRDF